MTKPETLYCLCIEQDKHILYLRDDGTTFPTIAGAWLVRDPKALEIIFRTLNGAKLVKIRVESTIMDDYHDECRNVMLGVHEID